MSESYAIYATILGMALVTALTRFTGYWIIGKVAIKGRVAAALEAMPAAVLAAIVTPTALATGFAETVAVAVTVLLALRCHTLIAVGGGVLTVVALRFAFAG
ncbi:AzlD domain-containing protein [Aestuariispira insulae]|uniref:Putative membrane protein n=1 Tax=Aestuariispira insulae TaxID=1461337 RepID=A0A3D9HJK2_9PROT|nr:AzlD domain-containing protein [Aestuariispira insulae]RED49689.1 putative membrane protein [Aestuariispira insulae]